jgi:DNA-binding beta-propeller fold protein YncE
MKLILWAAVTLGLATVAAVASPPPGPQPDGSTLLHNQWSIRPVGQQIKLGDFPVTIAVHPSGRYACILHSGYGAHQIWTVDLATQKVLAVTPVHETYGGLVFSSNGHQLYCTGGGDDVLHVFGFDHGQVGAPRDIPLPLAGAHAVIAGVAAGADPHTAFVTVLFSSLVMRVDLDRSRPAWTTALDPVAAGADQAAAKSEIAEIAPNDEPSQTLVDGADPLGLTFDPRRHRLYATLWGKSDVAVLDSDHGQILARWPVGLHPNDILLSRDQRRLFVSIGGKNSIVVLDPDTGAIVETLNSAFAPGDPPGSTPDSLALSPDGNTLFAANAYNNDIAVFDVSVPRQSRALGFIPTGWFPTSVRLTPDGRQLLVTSGRGLAASPNGSVADGPKNGRIITVRPGRTGLSKRFPYIGTLYAGSLGTVDLPRSADDREAVLRHWTEIAASCRPAQVVDADPANPIPAGAGGATPLRYVIYIIKENRTYDEVFGDLPEGNGDPSLCLFPEATTPNLHRLAREFVLLDNFYANAEISASGHEWSMGAYSSEFVERNWPLNYGHKQSRVPYPAEGSYVAAIPSLGYLWDRAIAAGVTFRDYGEFVHGEATPEHPSVSNYPALKGNIDPLYRGWSLSYSDLGRADRFISELRRFEAAGEMPRLQILRLPNDHTEAAKAGALTPRSMVAQNDLAVGRLVEAVSHSKFWPQTAIFVVEDDAQNGPDHVDAHRTEALVISPYVKRHAVDSAAYTSCSMLASIEKILGIAPMSQFDAAAAPMRASFGPTADLAPYTAAPAQISLQEHNPAGTKAAALSARFNFAHEDAIDDRTFNLVLWSAMRGENSAMPAPVHSAFVRPIKGKDDDDDDDDLQLE